MIGLLELVPIAGVMVGIIVLVIYYVPEARTLIGGFLVYFVILMMSTMFLGATIYLLSPSEVTLGIAVGVNMAAMIAALGYFFSVAENLQVTMKRRKLFYSLVSVLLVITEYLMGLTFYVAQFLSQQEAVGQVLLRSLVDSLSSYWFFYPMMLEMLSLYIILYLQQAEVRELFPLIGVTTFPPGAFTFKGWDYTSAVLSTAISIFGVVISRKISWRLLYGLAAFSSLVTLAVGPILFDLIVASSMVYYYYTSFLSEEGEGSRERGPLNEEVGRG